MDAATLRKLFPNAHPSFFEENQAHRPVQNAKPKRQPKSALGGKVQGEEKSMERVIVRFTGYRVRPLDPDNFAGGVKNLLDGLRHSKLIAGDEPWRIILQTDQVKVSSFKEERTEIEIEYP